MKQVFKLFAALLLLSLSCSREAGHKILPEPEENVYEPTWESLKKHTTPQWLRDAKFGIYTHWGVYCQTSTRDNATWNAHAAYCLPETEAAQDFYKKYGKLTPEFGYKDLISGFTGENFNAEEWADLFVKAGAKFAGPVAEHHDGFAMWDTKYSEWNAARMGPKRDVVGELEKAIKAKNMKFVTTFHHAGNWHYFPTWDKTKDCNNPEYSGLYGPVHEEDEMPNKEFLEEWCGKIIEVIDKYDPDFLWFDAFQDRIREDYVKKYVAYYYNKAVERGKEVVIAYKGHDLPPGAGLLDLERGQEPSLAHYDWITDTSIDDQRAWGHYEGIKYKSLERLIDNLVDRVSKNGYLLLNIGPKGDGTIPEEAKERLLGMGKWLEINGEAIYGTTSWVKYGEGPTGVTLNERGKAGFNEITIPYTSKDIRFTVKDTVLYAIVLDWPEEDVIIKSLVRKNGPGYHIYPGEIASVTMLGDGRELEWELIQDEGLKIKPPKTKPCEHAFVFKIVRNYDELSLNNN